MTKQATRRARPRHRMTKKKYVDHLKHLYPACRFDQKRDDYHLYEKHKITYGEMEYEGMQRLYSYVKKINGHIDTFIDVGSGRGKLCMFMASQPEISRVLGVELVTQRHEDALALKAELIEYQRTGKTVSKRVLNCSGGGQIGGVDYANKVTFLNQNVLEIEFAGYVGEVFVWFSNLCFDQSTTNDIFAKLAKELPQGSIICCSKEPSVEIGESIGEVIIPMSWSKNSTVFMYKII